MGRLIPARTWALTDSRSEYFKPCQAFFGALIGRKAWIVQATSPLEKRWKGWQKVHHSSIYYMDVFSEDELLALA